MSLSGVGAGIVQPNVLAMLLEISPREKRARDAAFWVFCLLPLCGSVLYAKAIGLLSDWVRRLEIEKRICH
jgi:dipeptide/tripeptide permease